MRTIASDYSTHLVKLADSIDRMPDCPGFRSSWIETLKDTCPLHRSSEARAKLLDTLSAVDRENPPQRTVDLLRMLSYVVRRTPIVDRYHATYQHLPWGHPPQR